MGVVSVIEAEKPSVALTLPTALPFEEWVTLGQRLCASSQVINWHIGDWWAFGEQRYGQRAKAAAEGVFGLSFQGLVDCATVARCFESTRRRVDLSFSHHREVAALPAPEADALLARAGAELLSTRELRQEVRALRDGQTREIDIIDVRRDDLPSTALITKVEVIIELATALGRERALTDRESDFLSRAVQMRDKEAGEGKAGFLGYRERQVLLFVRTRIVEDGRAPSYQMICDELGISTKGEVSRIVSSLERRGLISFSEEPAKRSGRRIALVTG